MKNLFFVGMFISLGLLPNSNASEGTLVGLGNPASANCIKLGGTLESVATPTGDQSNCVIDEWILFTAMNDRHLVKHHSSPGGANPAAVNCTDIGGTSRMTDTPAGQAGMCVVEEWTLFQAINVTNKP